MTTYQSIVISSGHGKKIRGAAGDPSGSPSDPYLDEVDEARKVVDALAESLEERGVDVFVFHDDTSTNQDTNLKTIVTAHNKRARQLDLSVHFNAYQQGSKCMGTEMLYVTQATLADDLSAAVAEAGGFINRGPKKNTGLYFLNNTDEPSVLLEICFCDSSCDTKLYRENFGAIIEAMATVLAGEGAAITPPPEERPPVFERPERPGRPVPPSAERPTIGRGDSGPDVVALQKSLGLPDADGDFGSITETQVIAFQKAAGLVADGIVGPTTWGYVDEVDRRMATGSSGMPKGLTEAVIKLAQDSPLMNYSWPDRSKSPPGYIPGMALCYAQAVVELERGNSAAVVMGEEASGDADLDALSWYEDELSDDLGLDVDTSGLETLRALFTLMIGLGMRESSGKYCEGRDMSADNVSSDTCEAGLFQMSANMNSASPEMKKLFNAYWSDPNGFLEVFSKGISPTASNLDVYGSGKGAAYQWLARFSPAFCVFTAAVGLRKRRQHWGPINRKEVTLSEDARDLLRDVELLVASIA